MMWFLLLFREEEEEEEMRRSKRERKIKRKKMKGEGKRLRQKFKCSSNSNGKADRQTLLTRPRETRVLSCQSYLSDPINRLVKFGERCGFTSDSRQCGFCG